MIIVLIGTLTLFGTDSGKKINENEKEKEKSHDEDKSQISVSILNHYMFV